MSRLRAEWLILAGMLWLAACQSSPPTRYFTLSEVSPSAPQVSLTDAVAIRVERVTVPGELDRLELVRHSESNQLRIATFELWAAPLDGMIRRVVTEDLAARLAPGSVASVSAPAAREQYRHLYLDVLEFAGDEHGAVKLRAAWLLQGAGGAELHGTEEVSATANDATAEALAAAMSSALGTLSDRLAVAFAAHAADAKSE
ncbi:MAG TPA: PqiC family protein [Steroidobacteraceae bacterium]